MLNTREGYKDILTLLETLHPQGYPNLTQKHPRNNLLVGLSPGNGRVYMHQKGQLGEQGAEAYYPPLTINSSDFINSYIIHINSPLTGFVL